VETTTDLGAGRNEVPAVQHHDADLLAISGSSSVACLGGTDSEGNALCG
jgi:hypothetical protein